MPDHGGDVKAVHGHQVHVGDLLGCRRHVLGELVLGVELETKVILRFFTITAPTGAFSWLKAPTSTFTFKTLLRHYAKRALTPQKVDVKLERQSNNHKGGAALRIYTNQPARPL